MSYNAVQPRPSSRNDFHIAIICTLPLEADGVESMFDKFWGDEGLDFGKAQDDPNAYTTGTIGGHNAVLVLMAQMGKVKIAKSAAWVKASFTRIKLALVVGICGAAPFSSVHEEIILGDIVVSEALIQYDFGRRKHLTAFQRKDTLDYEPGRAPLEVRALLNRMRTDKGRRRFQQKIVQYLSDPALPVKYTKYPGAKADTLFEPTYRHVHRTRATCAVCSETGIICDRATVASCEEVGCDLERNVPRERLRGGNPSGSTLHCPWVHIGRMASGDTIIRSAKHRDVIARRDAVIGFEMGGMGVWGHFPSLIIKGACDYADSHKNKAWQVFAAGTAAACAKAFLTEWLSEVTPIQDEMLPNRLLQSLPPSPLSVSTSTLMTSTSSISASTPVPPGNDHWMPTRPVNTQFIGREDILDEIESAIRRSVNDTESTFQRRFVIPGMGGLGKSELCLKLANSTRQSSRRVFWVCASSTSVAEKAYINIVKQMGQIVSNLPEAVQIIAEVGHLRLLIIGSTDDPAQDYDIDFSPGNRGIVLMTSRNPDCHTHQTIGSESLEGLPLEDAVCLLLTAANVPAEKQAASGVSARNVSRLLGYIARGHCRLDQYPDIHMRQPARLLRFHPPQAQSRHGNSYAAFEASAQILEASREKTAKDALDMLCTLSMLAAGEMAMHRTVELPLVVFEAAWEGASKVYALNDDNDDDLDGLTRWHTSPLPFFIRPELTEWDAYRIVEASHLLASLSLAVEHNVEHSTTVTMHPLVQNWAVGRQAMDTRNRALLSAKALIALASHSHLNVWQVGEEQLRPHLHASGLRSRIWGYQVNQRLSDSGYGSASAQKGYLSNSAITEGCCSATESNGRESDEYVELDGTMAAASAVSDERSDVASIFSNLEEIQSTVEVQKTPYILDAEEQLTLIFMDNVEIKDTCTELLGRMGKRRFVTNLRRLLKRYYLHLLPSAQVSIEKGCLELFKSRFTRTRVAVAIADKIRPHSDQTRVDVENDIRKAQAMRPDVERWLGGNPAFSLDSQSPPHKLEDSDATSDSASSTDKDEPEDILKYSEDLKHINRVKRFLTEGAAFRKLLLDIEMMLLPKELTGTAESLLATSEDNILFDVEQGQSSWNRWKIKIEQMTHTKWDWWPLSPISYPVSKGQSRVQWICHCSRRVCVDVPTNQISRLKRIVTLKGHLVLGIDLCQSVFNQRCLDQGGPTTVQLGDGEAASGQDGSVGDDCVSPNRSAASARSSGSSHNAQSTSVSGGSIFSQNGSSVSLASTNTSPGTSTSYCVPVHTQESHVVVGIWGKKLHIECVDTKGCSDDPEFFKELRSRNASIRGVLRHVFSIWQIDHCHFVKFRKYLPEVISAVAKDLPATSDYRYHPRPPTATPDDQIHYHVWPMLVNAPCCDTFLFRKLGRCPKSWLWGHCCVSPLMANQSRLLSRIPQRDSPWLRDTQDVEDAWGIYVQNVPRLTYVVCYQLLFLAGPFVFMLVWPLVKWRRRADTDSQDLQTPTVPMTLAIGALGTLWTWWQVFIPLGRIQSPYFT